MLRRILFIAFLTSVLTMLSPAQVRQADGARYIDQLMSSRFEKEGGDAHELWRRPWRLVVLFNSSHAEDNSSYTDAALTTVRTFLTARMNDGQPHRVWFVPYQLGAYLGPDQAATDLPLNSDSVARIEKLFPRVHFRMMPDGRTPYSSRGGHSNIEARKQVSELLGKSGNPTLIIQLTDIGIGEAPEQMGDEEIRKGDIRTEGVEAAGLVAYESSQTPLQTGSDGRQYSIFAYGPERILVSSTDWTRVLALALLAMAVLSIVGIILARVRDRSWSIGKSPRWSFTIQGNAAVVLEKGESAGIFGPGSRPDDGMFAVLKGEGVPEGKLFGATWTKSGVQLSDFLWEVRVAGSEGAPILSDSAPLTCKDRTSDKSRKIEITIRSI